MKRIICFLLFALCLLNVNTTHASVIILGRPIEEAGSGDYSDITFFLDMDAKDNASVSAGSASVTWGSAVTIDSSDYVVGTGSADSTDTDGALTSFSCTDNIPWSTGCRIGFHYKANEWDTGDYIISTSSSSNATIRVRANADDRIIVNYKGADQLYFDTDSSLDEWMYLEFKCDGLTCTIYKNGSSLGSIVGDTPASADPTMILWNSTEATANDSKIDNFIVSNDTNRDLYAIRTETDFS